jgi:hypothetical protein
MRVIKIQRRVRKRENGNRPGVGPFRRQFGDFFAKENRLEFAIEALLFGILLVISTWPIMAAAGAINEFL